MVLQDIIGHYLTRQGVREDFIQPMHLPHFERNKENLLSCSLMEYYLMQIVKTNISFI